MEIKTDSIKLGAEGRFALSVFKADGSEVVEKRSGFTDNVVTYSGAYDIFFNDSMFGNLYASMGTGTTELTRSSPSLGNLSVTSSQYKGASRAGEVDNGDGTSTLTVTRGINFPLGGTVGTYTEVGVCTNVSGAGFVAGQLIKDEFGDPTTITVLSDEQLKVTYTLELTFPNTSFNVGSGVLTDSNNNTYNYELWAQPYFSDYTVGANSEALRYQSGVSGGRATVAYGQDGTSIDGHSTGTWSKSLGSNGEVTLSGNFSVISPTDASFSNAYFIGLQAGNSTSIAGSISDTSKALSNSTSTQSISVVLKLLNPITKTNQQSFQLQVELKIQV